MRRGKLANHVKQQRMLRDCTRMSLVCGRCLVLFACVILFCGCSQFRATTPLAAPPPSVRAVSAEQTGPIEPATLLAPVIDEGSHITETGKKTSSAMGRKGDGETRRKGEGETRGIVNGRADDVKLVPISLDAVLRLAQEQNLKIHLAREQLAEAYLEKNLADKSWLPDVWVGPSYYRHEGGIQDFNGKFIHSSFGRFFGGFEIRGELNFREATILRLKAEQQIHRQRGEISKLTSETLLDAAETYIDLLSVREAELFTDKVETETNKLYKIAYTLAKSLPIYNIEVHSLQTALLSQEQSRRKMQHLFRAATAKLNYLLGLDSDVQLAPVDPRLTPVHWVDPSITEQQLVARALAQGPGVQELNDLLFHLEQGIREAEGRKKWLPVVEFRVWEGGFGAGPGGSMTWDNRLDVGLRLKWNLTDLCKAKTKRAIAQSKLQQVRLGIGDLQAKLQLAVKEARMASIHGMDRIALAKKVVESAKKAYDMSYERVSKTALKGPSPSQLLMALRAWADAQRELLEAIREHNQAQLRLMIVVGGAVPCRKSE